MALACWLPICVSAPATVPMESGEHMLNDWGDKFLPSLTHPSDPLCEVPAGAWESSGKWATVQWRRQEPPSDYTVVMQSGGSCMSTEEKPAGLLEEDDKDGTWRGEGEKRKV